MDFVLVSDFVFILDMNSDYDHFIPLTSKLGQTAATNQHFYWE